MNSRMALSIAPFMVGSCLFRTWERVSVCTAGADDDELKTDGLGRNKEEKGRVGTVWR